MAQQTYMASRMFSMLPLAIPFVGIVAPSASALVADGVGSGSHGSPDQGGAQKPAVPSALMSVKQGPASEAGDDETSA